MYLAYCIVKSGKNFRAVFRGRLFGSFATITLAEAARAAKIAEVNEAEWQEHVEISITRDQPGNAVLALTGDKAEGKFTRVSERFGISAAAKRIIKCCS